MSIIIKKISVFIKLFVSIGLLYIVFDNYVELPLVLAHIQEINWMYFFPMLLITLSSRWLMAYQTHISLKFYYIKIKIYDVLKIQFVSTLYGLVLPGDLASGAVTWYYFSKDNEQRAQVASSLLFLRLLNLITIIPASLLGLVLEQKLITLGLHWPLAVLSVSIIVITMPFLWTPAAVLFERLSFSIVRLIPNRRINEALQNLCNSIHLNATMSLHVRLELVVISLLIHIIGVFGIWVICSMINLTIPLFFIVIIRSILIIILTLPLTFSGTGLREISLISLLQFVYGIDASKSLIFSMLIFIFPVLFVSVPGIFFLTNIKKIKSVYSPPTPTNVNNL